jgi:hypothetical protein
LTPGYSAGYVGTTHYRDVSIWVGPLVSVDSPSLGWGGGGVSGGGSGSGVGGGGGCGAAGRPCPPQLLD